MNNLQTNATMWTVKDAAHFYNVSTKAIYCWVQRGDLPHYRVGTAIRFDPKELQAIFRLDKKDESKK